MDQNSRVVALHRQDERAKALRELEYRNNAVQTDHYGAIAEVLLALITEFSSDSWTGALEQVRGARASQDSN